MLRSYIHATSRRINYGWKPTDDPGITFIHGPLRMNYGLTKGSDGSTKDNARYGLVDNGLFRSFISINVTLTIVKYR